MSELTSDDGWVLILTNFRCYRNKTIRFTSGFVRLKGESASGKTTIVAAIQWVLYGVGSPEPENAKESRVRVSLRCPYFEIERTSNPQTVRLSPKIDGKIIPLSSVSVTARNSKILDGRGAQLYVNAIFGDFCIWEGSVSVPQDEKHALMGKSAADRREFINALIYKDENPDDEIDKATILRKKYQAAFADCESKMSVIKVPTQEIHDCPPKPTKTTQELKVVIATLMTKRKSLELAVASAVETNKKVIQLEVLSEQMKQYSGLPPSADVKKKIGALEKTQTLRKTHEKQIQERDYIVSQIGDRKFLPVAEIKAAKTHNQERAKHVESAVAAGVAYDKDEIQRLLKSLEDDLEVLKEQRDFYNEYSTAIKRKEKLEKDVPLPPDAKKLESLRAELQEIDHQLGADCNLACPACDVPLKLVKGALQKGEKKSPPPEQVRKLEAKKKEVMSQILSHEAAVQKAEQRQRDYEAIKAEIVKILDGDAPPQAQDYDKLINDSMTGIAWIKKIKIMDVKNIDTDDETIRLAELAEKLKKISIPESLPDAPDPKEVASLHSTLSECTRRDKLQKEISSFGSPSKVEEGEIWSEIEKIGKEIETLTVELDDLEKKWADFGDHSRCSEYAKLWDDRETANANLLAIDIVLNAERNMQEFMMREVVKNLNSSINYLLPELFEDDPNLKMEVSTIKVGKSTKKVTQDVNLVVTRGTANANGPSGGEKRRLSTILSLASARSFGVKILVCDESINGISEQRRKGCFEIIKEILPKIPIIVISHDDPDGFFDQVIECSKKLWDDSKISSVPARSIIST